MTDDEKFLFDLNGYIIVEGVLSADELAFMNEAIDRHAPLIREHPESLAGGSPNLKGRCSRGGMGAMMQWDRPWCEPFRKMIAHPKIVAYLNVILGSGFRLDHGQQLVTMNKGTEGHILHGSSGPGFDPNQYYIVRDGRMHNGLTVTTWQLTDVNEGDGGFSVIPGSHKSNYPCPAAMRRDMIHRSFIKPLTCKAGDVIIFTEALTHGTRPWQADHDRRSVLMRYTAANLAYSSRYIRDAYDGFLSELTDAQRAVIESPYHTRLRRPVLDDEGNALRSQI